MAEEDGGRWDVGVKDDLVYLARLTNDGERLFDEQLLAHEARQLGELLTKYAAKADEGNDREDRDEDDDEREDEDERDEEGEDDEDEDEREDDRNDEDKDDEDKDDEDKDDEDKDDG